MLFRSPAPHAGGIPASGRRRPPRKHGAAAHLIHGSSDGRFSITYCVKNISKEEVEGVGFKAADYDEMVAKYDPSKLQYGYNTVDGCWP